ncbi:nucleoside triphosphate pyrophosphohydrolase [candidate division KSB1 bacterium]|nr:nucleoside triphosphate pyrophosphohydrolase [candidate division KSB1 bacterium]
MANPRLIFCFFCPIFIFSGVPFGDTHERETDIAHSGKGEFLPESEKKFTQLIEIMAKLRSPEGCPWDREQTHESLRQHLLEEAYEVIEAIDEHRIHDLADELGDLLLQIIFHAQMAAERKEFTITQVLDAIIEKLIRRHPHVFGDEKVESASDQIKLWEKTKLTKEGKRSAIDGIPKQLPALIRAYRMQNKAAAVGFDWSDIEPVWDKVEEELLELRDAVGREDSVQIEEELGDVLFSLVNLSRFLHKNPEDALRHTIEKFKRRFQHIEAELKKQNRSLSSATLEEMDAIWNRIKQSE